MADRYSDPYWGGFYPGASFPYGAFPPYGVAEQEQTATSTTCMAPGTSSSNCTSKATPPIVVESGDDVSDHTADSGDEQVCF